MLNRGTHIFWGPGASAPSFGLVAVRLTLVNPRKSPSQARPRKHRTGEDDDKSNKELVLKSVVNTMVGFLKLWPCYLYCHHFFEAFAQHLLCNHVFALLCCKFCEAENVFFPFMFLWPEDWICWQH